VNGLLALLGALAVAVVLGLLLRAREGRVRLSRRRPASAGATAGGGSARPADELPPAVRKLVVDPPEQESVTLLQLSTTFCAPCRQASAALASLAEATPGLRHVELDVTNTPEIATRLGVLRTPTMIAFDAEGTELLRVGGVPRRDALLDTLRPHLR
jgi:thiol-disulfide isomerase/thioredoxin